MASKTITTTEFVDDLDGGRAEGTVSFAFDGKTYEIDLSKKNKSAFEKVLKPYVDHARKVRATRAKAASSPGKRRSDLAAVREWAKGAGYEVSDRGRISQEIQDAFDAK